MITIKITIKLFEWQSEMHHRYEYHLNSFFSSAILYFFASRSLHSTTLISTTLAKLHLLKHNVYSDSFANHIEYRIQCSYSCSSFNSHNPNTQLSSHLLTHNLQIFFLWNVWMWALDCTNKRFHVFFWQYGIWLSSCCCIRNGILFVSILRKKCRRRFSFSNKRDK